MRQLAAVDALAFTEAEYESLIEAKTASLLMRRVRDGRDVRRARGTAPRSSATAQRLGMAFQVADDILDYTETAVGDGEADAGSIFASTRSPCRSSPRCRSCRRRRAGASRRCSPPRHRRTSRSHEVVGLVTEAGGIDAARRRGEQYALEADAALRGLPDTPARAALADAILYVMDRRS